MKRFIWALIVLLALGACSRNRPTPTPQPSPTRGTPTRRATSTALPTRVSRITIVPSATRLPASAEERPVQSGTPFTGTLPTHTATPIPSVVPSPTSTPRVIDAGATATAPPTAPPPESPLSTPTPMEEVPSPAIDMPTPSATPEEDAPGEQATATLDTEDTTDPTHTPTVTPRGAEANWRFENVHTYYNDVNQAFYISGESVNESASDQRITTLWPQVYDLEGYPVNTQSDVEALGQGYEALQEGISLAPGKRLAFSFRVALPEGAVVDDFPTGKGYEWVIASEPAEASRQDLGVLEENVDSSAWPAYFYVDGVFENPGPDLNAYVAVVVTLYDYDGRVIGVGWTYERAQAELSSGEHGFQIQVETWPGLDELGLEIGDHTLQLFGY